METNSNMDNQLDEINIFRNVREEQNVRKANPLPKRNLSEEIGHMFTLEEIKAELHFWKQTMNYLSGRGSSSGRGGSYFNKICGLCLAQPKEQKWLVKFRKAGFRNLKAYLLSSTPKEVQSKDVKLLTWCSLNLLSFYYSRQNHRQGCNCFKMQRFDQAKALHRSAMYLILPEKQNEVIKHTIRYITITEQWNKADYDSFVCQELLSMITKPEILLAKIIKQVEISQHVGKLKEALDISCTMSSILERSYWDKYLFNHLLHNCFNTLLKTFLICNIQKGSTLTIENAKMRMVLKICIKNFISNIKDNKGLVSVMDSIARCLQDTTIGDEDRIEIMEMIVFTSQRHRTIYFRESITPDLLNLLLNGLLSNNKDLTMTTHKIFHHLMDRHENGKHFTEPVYYFKGRSNFTINKDCGTEDIHFFKSFSMTFLDGIYHSLLSFNNKYELVMCYTTLCLVLVEIPEPVITINVIHVIIRVQNYVLKHSDSFPQMTNYHIHATVSSVLSLVCLIHQDEVNSLKRYVEEVVRFRTENSPHLLPPLQNMYSIASHHTTVYHDQLYFLEQEVLYALQRCWLGRRVT